MNNPTPLPDTLLDTWRDPRTFLTRHRLRPKDSFGQCFLIARPVAESIVAAAAVAPEDTVVEIGTGCGTLARMLSPFARRVIAIERDRDLVKAFAAEGQGEHAMGANVELLEEDAAAFDYAAQSAREPTVIVGNLPYQITGKLIRAMLTAPVKWKRAVIMVQREVGARLLSQPGDDDWSVLGVFTSAACTVARVTEASPACFYPSPTIHSSVVCLTPRAEPLAIETPVFQRVVKELFHARRKTIANGLAGVAGGKERALAVCLAAGVDPGLRPEVLPISALRALAEHAASKSGV